MLFAPRLSGHRGAVSQGLATIGGLCCRSFTFLSPSFQFQNWLFSLFGVESVCTHVVGSITTLHLSTCQMEVYYGWRSRSFHSSQWLFGPHSLSPTRVLFSCCCCGSWKILTTIIIKHVTFWREGLLKYSMKASCGVYHKPHAYTCSPHFLSLFKCGQNYRALFRLLKE